MQYEEFEIKVLTQLSKDKKKCIDTINDNKKLVQAYLKDVEKPHIKKFVGKLNVIIIEELKKFKLVEKVLRHELFTEVLAEFRESTILIEAIKKGQNDTIKWLFSMDINSHVQDENGMTALMHACEYPNLFAIEELLKKNDDSIYMVDKNGETVLFHSITNEKAFNLISDLNSIDFNYINKNNENILINACKKPLIKESVYLNIMKRVDDIYSENKEGKTAAQYLVERGRASELLLLFKRIYMQLKNENTSNNDDTKKNQKRNSYVVKYNKVLVTTLMNKFIDMYKKNNLADLRKYVETMIVLLGFGYDFNIPIDKAGNTPFMFFMMAGDLYTCTFLLQWYQDLDLSIKNEQGISAEYLSLFIYLSEKTFLQQMYDHKSFNFNYCDCNKNNLLIHLVVRDYTNHATKVIIKSKKSLVHVNDKNENVVIIATKLGKLKEIYITPDNVNQQDYLGNTALFYAVKLKDAEAINMLRYFHADPNIKNYQNFSAFDLATQINEEKIFEIIKNPISPNNMAEKIKKDGKAFLFIDKKKTADEKLEDYVQNYQIDNYKKEYEYIIDKQKLTYPTLISKLAQHNMFIGVYYNLYSLKAPNMMVKQKEEDKFKDRLDQVLFYSIFGYDVEDFIMNRIDSLISSFKKYQSYDYNSLYSKFK